MVQAEVKLWSQALQAKALPELGGDIVASGTEHLQNGEGVVWGLEKKLGAIGVDLRPEDALGSLSPLLGGSHSLEGAGWKSYTSHPPSLSSSPPPSLLGWCICVRPVPPFSVIYKSCRDLRQDGAQKDVTAATYSRK